MVVVGFPTRFEAAGLIRALQGVKKNEVGKCPYFQGCFGETQVVVAVLGMGSVHSAQHMRLLLELFSPRLFILAGFAGALVKGLEKGQVFLVEDGCSETLKKRLKGLKKMDAARAYSTRQPITSVEEKEWLAEASGCQLVDMETTAVFAVAQEKGMEMLTVRVVSDLADERLPSALAKGYDFIEARETPWRFFFYLFFHPHQLAPFLKFLIPLFSARGKFTRFLLPIIQEADLALVQV
ncbi:MAG: hypothetical protein V1746_06385 [bacterium]